jgi:uncharacterized protein (DUF983 family)
METNKKKSSVLWAATNCKCPRCHQGNIFQTSAFNLAKFSKTNERCPVCHLKFEKEPGFFVGAMYFSYAVSVAIFIAVGIGLVILSNTFQFEAATSTYIISIITISLLLMPLNFRYSRIMMLYFFGGEEAKYNPSIK